MADNITSSSKYNLVVTVTETVTLTEREVPVRMHQTQEAKKKKLDRNTSRVAHLVIGADSINELINKTQSHLALLKEEEIIQDGERL